MGLFVREKLIYKERGKKEEWKSDVYPKNWTHIN